MTLGRQALAILAFLAIFTASGRAQSKPLQPYPTLILGNLSVDPDLKKAGFPAGYEDVLQKGLFARLFSDQIFPQVLDGLPSDSSERLPGNALIAEGEVADYDKGSRAARVAIGYGAGSAKIKVILRFRDLSTGREVLTIEQTGRYAGFGNITGGSADKARTESARKVVEGLVKKIRAAR